MILSKRERMRQLADRLAGEDTRLTLSKNMLRIVISESARDVIVEALRTVAELPPPLAAHSLHDAGGVR